MAKLIIILLVSLVLEAVGVVYLSCGLKQIAGPQQLGWVDFKQLLTRGLANRNILAGVAFEALFFGGILILMSKGDISFIWPLTSLGFVLTTLAARFIIGEKVSWVRWSGVLLIMAGAGLIIWSEKTKEPRELPLLNQSEGEQK